MRRAATVLAFAALGLSACPGPVRLPRPAARPDAARLFAALDAQRAAVSGIRARARIRSGVAGMWAREAVVVERPRSVRVDVLSPFGLALALGTDGSLLWVFPPSEGVRYVGPATPENLARFFGTPVAVADLVDILLGVPPRREPVGTARITWTGRAWRIEVPHAAGVQALIVDAATGAVLEAVERPHGTGAEVRVRFHDRRDGFPHAIDVSAPALDVDARLRYADVEYNPVLDASVFRGPAAVPVRPLDLVRVRQ